MLSDDMVEQVEVVIRHALNLRVVAHRSRQAGALAVPDYKRVLAAVRDVEDALEPLRGAEHSLAYELSVDALRARDQR